MKDKNRQKGFTLIELMVVVALIGIFFATGVSTFSSTIQRSTIKAVSDDISGMIARARMSALVSGRSTVVCPVANVTAAPPMLCQNWTTLAAGASNGSIGMVVFNDPDGNNQVDNTGDLVASLPFDDRGGKAGITTASDDGPVRFTRRGNLASSGTTFRIQSSNPTYARVPYDREVIVAAIVGRICSQIVQPGPPGCRQ